MIVIQQISYRGRTVAACTTERIFLVEALEHRPPGDPELVFVLFMCAYARDVLGGLLPGPYNDADARRYARACLIPTELLERPTIDERRAAATLGVPASELRTARDDHLTPARPVPTTPASEGRATPCSTPATPTARTAASNPSMRCRTHR